MPRLFGIKTRHNDLGLCPFCCPCYFRVGSGLFFGQRRFVPRRPCRLAHCQNLHSEPNRPDKYTKEKGSGLETRRPASHVAPAVPQEAERDKTTEQPGGNANHKVERHTKPPRHCAASFFFTSSTHRVVGLFRTSIFARPPVRSGAASPALLCRGRWRGPCHRSEIGVGPVPASACGHPRPFP